MDGREPQVGDAVGLAQPLEAELADPPRRELAAGRGLELDDLGDPLDRRLGVRALVRGALEAGAELGGVELLRAGRRACGRSPACGAQPLEGGEAVAAGAALAAAPHGGAVVGRAALDDPGSVVTKGTNHGFAKVLAVVDGKTEPPDVGFGVGESTKGAREDPRQGEVSGSRFADVGHRTGVTRAPRPPGGDNGGDDRRNEAGDAGRARARGYRARRRRRAGGGRPGGRPRARRGGAGERPPSCRRRSSRGCAA